MPQPRRDSATATPTPAAPSSAAPAAPEPGRVNRTRYLPPSSPGPSPLAAEGMPPGEPAFAALQLDDPFGFHLTGGPSGNSTAPPALGPDGRPRPAPAPAHHDRMAESAADEAEALRAIEAELVWLIDNAEWSKLRPSVVAVAARAPRARARARREGTLPDLTGIGSVAAVDSIAAGIRTAQQQWVHLTIDERARALQAAADGALAVAGLPALAGIEQVPGRRYPAGFNFRTWKIALRAELVSAAALPDEDAELLCDFMAHESRHAEQQYVLARRLAIQGFSPAEISGKLRGLYPLVAEQAFALRLDDLPPGQESLADEVEPAFTSEVEINGYINGDDGQDDMAAARVVAANLLDGLRATPRTTTLADARAAGRALRERMEDVVLDYTLYHQLATEDDAHEVGAAADLAFEVAR
jgi:hypothetical protein